VLWQALGLQKHVLHSDVRGAVTEIVKLVDEKGQNVDVLLNYTKHTVTLLETSK